MLLDKSFRQQDPERSISINFVSIVQMSMKVKYELWFHSNDQRRVRTSNFTDKPLYDAIIFVLKSMFLKTTAPFADDYQCCNQRQFASMDKWKSVFERSAEAINPFVRSFF